MSAVDPDKPRYEQVPLIAPTPARTPTITFERFFLAMVALFGAWLLGLLAYKDLQAFYRDQRLIEGPARVVSTQVQSRELRNGTVAHTLVIEYQYSLGSLTYTNRAWSSRRFASVQAAEEARVLLTPQTPIVHFYDPQEPTYSDIDPHPVTSTPAKRLAPYLLAAVSTVVVFVFTPRRRLR